MVFLNVFQWLRAGRAGQTGVFAALALCISACGQSSPFPDMQPGERGRVVRIIDGDALVLDTGQSVRLVAIEAPAPGRRGRPPAPYAKEAARSLEDMALGRQVQLFYPGLTRDRYDRALAHVLTIDASGPELWLNMELVKRGAARVRFYPDTASQVAAFLAAEQVARAEKAGLWALKAYHIAAPDGLDDDETRGFQIVQASLEMAEPVPEDQRTAFACQRRAGGGALIVRIANQASEACALPVGAEVRLRGWVSGGVLELSVAAHAETIF